MGAYNLISEVIFGAFAFHFCQNFHFFFSCLFFQSRITRVGCCRLITFYPVYTLIFPHVSAGSHLKCTGFISALREINVLSRCPCCAGWNKSPQKGVRLSRLGRLLPLDCPDQLLFLPGWTGLSGLQGVLTEHLTDSRRMVADLGAPTSIAPLF